MDRLAALEAHDLYRFYHAGEDETLALRGVSLRLEQGEFVAVTGPSGSGKSTLLACLAGLDEPDGGWVAVAGERLTRRPEGQRSRLRAKRIGILLQSGNLFDRLTVAENVLAARSAPGTRPVSGAIDIIDQVGLSHRRHSLPALLSGGESARAGLAVALANEPDILLADEPTGEVDAENEGRLLALIRSRANNGGATLAVTHSPAVAAQADRILHLVDGQIRHG